VFFVVISGMYMVFSGEKEMGKTIISYAFTFFAGALGGLGIGKSMSRPE
jgi:hypothetical protein